MADRGRATGPRDRQRHQLPLQPGGGDAVPASRGARRPGRHPDDRRRVPALSARARPARRGGRHLVVGRVQGRRRRRGGPAGPGPDGGHRPRARFGPDEGRLRRRPVRRRPLRRPGDDQDLLVDPRRDRAPAPRAPRRRPGQPGGRRDPGSRRRGGDGDRVRRAPRRADRRDARGRGPSLRHGRRRRLPGSARGGAQAQGDGARPRRRRGGLGDDLGRRDDARARRGRHRARARRAGAGGDRRAADPRGRVGRPDDRGRTGAAGGVVDPAPAARRGPRRTTRRCAPCRRWRCWPSPSRGCAA